MTKRYKYLLSLLCCFCFAVGMAQQPLPIVQASAKNAYFLDKSTGERNNWGLAPDARPDIYRIDKISKARTIVFHTDIDSLLIKIKPGETFHFIVLLNGKDSCFTQVVSPPTTTRYASLKPAQHDTIPFVITSGNNLKIKALLNNRDSLDLYFDSGSTAIVLTHEAVAHKTRLLSDYEPGYETSDYEQIHSFSSLQIGQTHWDSLRVYPVTNRGQDTDGSFGWDLFDGRVVEIDYDHQWFIIHSSLSHPPKGYAKLPIEYTHTLFCIGGELKAKGKRYKSRFLFDTGFQRALMLDSILMKEQHFPQDLPVLKVTRLRNGAGQIFETKTVNCDGLIFGKYTAQHIPARLLSTGNPARFKTHILGNELLKRYNTILDFQQNYVYLKPNSLMPLPYADKQ